MKDVPLRASLSPVQIVKKHPHAFTLVELLVVIGIIAVLISLLLPALNKARQSAIAVQCSSNMREIGMSMAQFAQLHKGRYPGRALNTHTSNPNVPWCTILSGEQFKVDDYIPQISISSTSKLYCPASLLADPGYNNSAGNHRDYAMSKYAAGGYNSSDVATLPDEGQYGSEVTPATQFDPGTSSYTYTRYFLGTRVSAFQDASNKYLVTEIERAADYITPNGNALANPPVIHVKDYWNDPGNSFGSPGIVDAAYPAWTAVEASTKKGGLVAYRHAKRTNILFVDGHVESRTFDFYVRDLTNLQLGVN